MAHDRKPSHVRGSNRAAKYFGITLQQYAALAAVVVLVAIVVAALLPGSSAPERWAGQASRAATSFASFAFLALRLVFVAATFLGSFLFCALRLKLDTSTDTPQSTLHLVKTCRDRSQPSAPTTAL